MYFRLQRYNVHIVVDSTIGSSCQNFWIPVSRTGMTKVGLHG
ncbi:hypothetical protein ASM33_08175 [Wolbachia endosymbiont of Folsomia candida]|nr:hypothetical protein ASM33_08175 [Wolbachia endosymbiont of Folsomia candida]